MLMKRFFVFLFVVIVIILCFSSCNSNEDVGDEYVVNGTNIESEVFTIADDMLNCEVSNSTTEFRFYDNIVVAPNASYIVAKDVQCENVIQSKTVQLEVGDNTFFILVTKDDDVKLYTATIRRLAMYNVLFKIENSDYLNKNVEEGSLISKPEEPNRIGYSFVSWDYDFTRPITQNIVINSKWIAASDIPYKIEYWLENSEGSYDLQEANNYVGTTDTNVSAEIKSFEHFTYNDLKSTEQGKIKGDGSLVLKVYYERDLYSVYTSDYKAGCLTDSGQYAYETNITVIARANLGYVFEGWYINNKCVEKNDSYSFTITSDVEARFSVSSEMSNYIFSSTSSTCEIESVKDNTVTEISIPEYVTSIKSRAFSKCASLEKIYYNSIEMNDLEDDSYAFYRAGNNSKGIEFIIGENVKKIPAYLFYTRSSSDAPKITSVVFADKSICKYIGGNAFGLCTSLKNVFITDIKSWCEIDSKTNLFAYADNLYYNNELITNLKIPEGTEIIGNYSFYNCVSITSISIPDSVKNIGYKTFYNCTSLSSVEIGKGLTSIGTGAFDGCTKINSVYFDDITSWCQISFANVKDNPLYYSKGFYVGGSYVTALEIPEGVTSIGSYTFYNCKNIESVSIPDSVITIGTGSFGYCTKIASMKIPFVGASRDATGDESHFGYIFGRSSWGSSMNYDYHIFDNDSGNYIKFAIPSSIKSVILGDNATRISQYAFYNCDSISNVTISENITSIGAYAFASCSNLTSVIFINPNEWIYLSSPDVITIGANSLSYKSTAAKYLTSTYYEFEWKRN